jgi:Spy/CpxP family protein refolding chaperone
MERSTTLKAGIAAVVACLGTAAIAQVSPYAGQERYDIKSLSPQEVTALLAGQGAGFAKAAELNGYPGPAHVIELADQLALTPKQLQGSQQLMDEHKQRARSLGAELVAAEHALDRLFAERRADAVAVENAAERIALLQGRLRAEHLNTHLLQTAVLSAEQARSYSELRGYAAGSTPGVDLPKQDSRSHHPQPH